MEYDYETILEVLNKIWAIEDLKDRLFLSGGIVPWMITDTNSNRKHGDIDFICKQEDMPFIRLKLMEYGLYDEKLDSLKYKQGGSIQDFGVDTYISGVPVGFYPYEVINNKIIQRSFSPDIICGKRDLKVKIIEGITEGDYLTKSTLKDGTVIGHSTLEIIRATKVKTGRQKDLYDVLQIDEIGTDIDRQKRVDVAIENMISTLDERKRKNLEKKHKVSDDFGEF